MDFERAAIKTLFYDYPVETAIKELFRDKDSFMDIFSDITRWRSAAFTVSEWRLLEKILRDEWLCNLREDSDHNEKPISRILNILPHISPKLLTIDSERQPRVEFKNLFRWRDMVLLLGEDLLTTSYVAYYDYENSDANISPRTSFLWDDVLPHNNRMLNEILSRGLSDVHAHLYASFDIFQYNWISLMNSARESFKPLNFKYYEDLIFCTTTTKERYSHYSLCVAAAYLREALFTKIILEKPIKDSQWKEVINILSDETVARNKIDSLQGSFLEARTKDITEGDNITFDDYAIVRTPSIAKFAHHPNILYQGERNLFYQFFLQWYQGNDEVYKIAHYFYLYLLIKTHIRREYVETNALHGFENFSAIQRRKTVSLHSSIKDSLEILAVRSSLRIESENNTLEARVAPIDGKEKDLQDIIRANYGKYLDENEKSFNYADKLSFTIHFLKDKDGSIKSDGVRRHDVYIKNCLADLNMVLRIAKGQQNEDNKDPKIVGIDAAGSELKCRPEVFGHLFRYAAKHNILGRTYHVGEDFFDLADGLRAIDEAMLFLQLDSHCRIGHALALSVNTEEYYTKRHYKMLISKQALLDNCVWLYYKAKEYNLVLPGEIDLFLQDTAMTLFADINYESDFSMLHYWHSMLLRGNDDQVSIENKESLWYKSAYIDTPLVLGASKDKVAQKILTEYMTSAKVKTAGSKACEAEYPKQIVPLIGDIQKAMIREIAEKGIAIECCPSSNVIIGGFERYDKHPIFTFKPIEAKPTDPIINVSINTDDAGIFATNISNEYSLITLAMMKMKDENGHRLYNDETIYNYIERVRANGMIQRFKID